MFVVDVVHVVTFVVDHVLASDQRKKTKKGKREKEKKPEE